MYVIILVLMPYDLCDIIILEEIEACILNAVVAFSRRSKYL